MKITIKGTNIKLSDSIYDYIEKKLNPLEKFAPTMECWVEVERMRKGDRSGDVFRAEAQIKLPRASGVRAESKNSDLLQAIDTVKDELQRQLKRYKEKQITQRRR